MKGNAYLSLGSNLGDRAGSLTYALQQLSTAGRIASQSSMYETEPVDVADQPWFLNCAVCLETSFPAAELLTNVLSIERLMGRHRSQIKGARSIDVDIVLYGDFIIETPELTIPHPAMHRRRFVLEPLAEIAPNLVHPLLHKTISRLLAELPQDQIVRKVTSA